jgi:LPXTG-motif cell wall-anchored protein
VSDAVVVSQPESGPAGWMWLAGMGLVAVAIVLAAARRRRLDTYYA